MSKKILIVACLVFFLIVPRHAKAIAFGLPFGGPILSVLPPSQFCPFPVIVVGAPRPGAFAIVPKTRLYAYFAIRKGAQVLGVALPIPVCLLPPALPIIMMGTTP